MPRKKTDYAIDYTRRLTSALDTVRICQMNPTQASNEFKITRKTLYKKGIREGDARVQTKTKGHPRVFSDEQEASLVAAIKAFGCSRFPLTGDLFLELANDYRNDLREDEEGQSTVPLGRDWLRAFVKRHRRPGGVTHRIAEQLERKRSDITPEKLRYFYEGLEALYTKHGFHSTPHRVSNADESGFNSGKSRQNVLTEMGAAVVNTIVGANYMENRSVLAGGRADGKRLPPFTVYKSKARLMTNWCIGGPPGAQYERTVSGWMTSSAFLRWFEHIYLPWARCARDTQGFLDPPTAERPHLLILDGHYSHVSVELMAMAEREHIIIWILPSKCTHVLQPMDVAVFKQAKTEADVHKAEHFLGTLGANLDKKHFPKMLKKIWQNAIKSSDIIAGFRATGIFPLDPSKVFEKLYPGYDNRSRDVIDDVIEQSRQWATSSDNGASDSLLMQTDLSSSHADDEFDFSLLDSPKRASTPIAVPSSPERVATVQPTKPSPATRMTLTLSNLMRKKVEATALPPRMLERHFVRRENDKPVTEEEVLAQLAWTNTRKRRGSANRGRPRRETLAPVNENEEEASNNVTAASAKRRRRAASAAFCDDEGGVDLRTSSSGASRSSPSSVRTPTSIRLFPDATFRVPQTPTREQPRRTAKVRCFQCIHWEPSTRAYTCSIRECESSLCDDCVKQPAPSRFGYICGACRGLAFFAGSH